MLVTFAVKICMGFQEYIHVNELNASNHLRTCQSSCSQQMIEILLLRNLLAMRRLIGDKLYSENLNLFT